ncbi:MAG: globin [Streptosporangiaceae bacterium]
MQDQQITFYDAVGGEETFRRLIHRFYQGVREDPHLRSMYPDDLNESEDKLALFLIQYWGGPRTYSERRGHPRLRMRHVPFRIGETERDAWLAHMRAALDDIGLPERYDTALWDYLVRAAHGLLNAPQGPGEGRSLPLAP